MQSSGTAVHDVVVAPLDLRLPDMAASTAEARNPLERAPAVEARPTRFAQAWVPEGDALRQASFRSAAVGVAAAAFGGPPRRCKEVERRLRKANCLPLHGGEADDEVLRRSLDP
ncbi:hypothetical protein [Cognatilysobacter segetis]|uniref:hypothetical protein n=1 Tax=Cognatilysobacter segetis TaxID=2492394 RepID=UPI00105C2F1D|nr:hypothetical protein [Lysobacter segetis]